jgi:ribosomal protein S18 acetylase RimI-like enzyme
MKLHFEQCAEDDLESVVSLVNKSYRGESSKTGWTTEESLLGGQRTDVDMIRTICQTDGNELWLAKNENNQLVGLFHLEKEGERAFLGMLTVDPSLQAQGLGRRLLTEGERRVREDWKKSELYMTVISLRTELIAYYQRRGYQPTGEAKPFPMNDPRYGIPKRNDFHLMVIRKSLE